MAGDGLFLSDGSAQGTRAEGALGLLVAAMHSRGQGWAEVFQGFRAKGTTRTPKRGGDVALV